MTFRFSPLFILKFFPNLSLSEPLLGLEYMHMFVLGPKRSLVNYCQWLQKEHNCVMTTMTIIIHYKLNDIFFLHQVTTSTNLGKHTKSVDEEYHGAVKKAKRCHQTEEGRP